MTMTSLSGWRSRCACSSSSVQARTTGRNATARSVAAASVGSVVLPSPVKTSGSLRLWTPPMAASTLVGVRIGVRVGVRVAVRVNIKVKVRVRVGVPMAASTLQSSVDPQRPVECSHTHLDRSRRLVEAASTASARAGSRRYGTE
eukprot:scaffold89267_cov63-Phaeocystis_antarctica.AAC.4